VRNPDLQDMGADLPDPRESGKNKGEMPEQETIEDIIAGHAARNAALRQTFLEKNVDLREPRIIECNFWLWSEKDAAELSEALKNQGFEILTQRSAARADNPDLWNVEAAIRQSIDLTMRPEFTDELARLADSYAGVYDGWGTSI
jgi:hypothetical protein